MSSTLIKRSSRDSSPDVELVDSSALGKHTDVVVFENVHRMNPMLWGDILPQELKQLIFARLPLPEIKHLRVLSKEWKSSIDTAGSLFREVCAQASTRMFALITPGNKDGIFHVNAYDPRLASRWHVVKYTAPGDRLSVTICACDGGLACFLFRTSSVREGAQVYLSVWNPLTGDENELPVLDSLKRSRASGIAVQLCVDHHTKRYKVTVVVMDVSGFHGVVHGYDSGTRQWSTAMTTSNSDILGYAYHCKASLASHCCRSIRGHWKYNFARREVGHYKLQVSNAYTDYRYFRLWKPPENRRGTYYVLEEHFCHRTRKYQRAKKHRCSFLEGFARGDPEQKVNLYSCKGFLVLCASPCLWLYDLITCKWQDLPALPQDLILREWDVMCELQWNIVP